MRARAGGESVRLHVGRGRPCAHARVRVCVHSWGCLCGGGVHVCVDGMQMPGWGYFVCVHAQRVMHARAWVHV